VVITGPTRNRLYV